MSERSLIFDAHLDLSMNAMDWNRDLRWSIQEIRESEKGLTDLTGRGQGTVNFSSMRQGGIGICVATILARYVKKGNPLSGWKSPDQAWAHVMGQVCWYKRMEEEGHLRGIRNATDLTEHFHRWIGEEVPTTPIGFILSLEGADSIVSMEHLERLYKKGLRALGPAHYGPGTYAHGTDSEGGIGQKGKELLDKMAQLNIILDATHLCDTSFWEALEHYGGPVWASHSNCRSIVPGERQFSDDQLKVLIEKKGVIGVVLNTWMMVPCAVKGRAPRPEEVTAHLIDLVDHIDHICHLAGNTDHVGIGSDLDGGFGKDFSPQDLDTIGDMKIFPEILTKRGFSDSDIKKILHQNWIDFLKKTWT